MNLLQREFIQAVHQPVYQRENLHPADTLATALCTRWRWMLQRQLF
jgi:hypothetical protein